MGIKLLIVEDEALIAENLRFTLEDLGYEITGICYTFEEALAAFQTAAFDLVLLDINLGNESPEKTGLSLAEILRRKLRPFIFLTAYNDRETILEASGYSPDGYLIKPVNPASLFATIQIAFEHSGTERQVQPDHRPEAPDFFFVKVGNRNIRLLWKDVYCIESGKNYVQVCIANSQVQYSVRGTLTFVMSQLVPAGLRDQFLQINRACCIHPRFITSYDQEAVYLGTRRIENTRVPQSRLCEFLAK